MFSRKSDEINKVSALPAEFSEKLVNGLNQEFQSELESANKYFYILAELYQEELVVITSLMHTTQIHLPPISLFLSIDINDKWKPKKDIVDQIYDFISIVFGEILTDKEWNEFQPAWIDTMLKKIPASYKITRENILLTLEANKYLNQEA